MRAYNLLNTEYSGANGRKSLIDLKIPTNGTNDLVLFVHGFMGFKDWGCWSYVEDYFLQKGVGFCKFNMSHNGGTHNIGMDFPDPLAFSENTYSKELFDLNQVLNWLESRIQPFPNLYIIGHSRGGGIALLKGTDPRVKKIATWASISNIASRFPSDEELANWKATGVRYITNSRTKQELPCKYNLFEDYIKNKESLDIQNTCRQIKIPVLLLHGDQDTSVPLIEGEQLSKWIHRPLYIVKGANHTFGTAHPWDKQTVPHHLKEICKLTADFFLEPEN
jgi:uncharacterized protein